MKNMPFETNRRYSKMWKGLFEILLSVKMAWGAITAGNTELTTQIADTLNNRLNSRHYSLISEIYKTNNFKPFWVGPENAGNYAALMNVLENPIYNYQHRNFNLRQIHQLSFSIDNGEISARDRSKVMAGLDVIMSDAFIHILQFLQTGDVDWPMVQQKLRRLKETQDVQAVWEIHPKTLPDARELTRILNSGNLIEWFHKQLPLTYRYRGLVELLGKYRRMPDFQKLHEGRKLRKGSTDERIPQIKRMLKFFGDLPKNRSEDDDFDRYLAKAVKTFRERFKLPPGEFIDNKMIHYLNTPKKEYLKKILVNLEKIKLYPSQWEKEYVEVNVPEYKMRFYQNGKQIFESDVVVGRIDRPTPIFDSKMTYMVLNPTWTIPDNLVRRDLIPMLKKNPEYLSEHNIHVYTSYKPGAQEVEPDFEKLFGYEHDDRPIPYRFVQFPSENNALGKVKFMFPNKYSVYLHDTDNKKLFGYRYRVFSSGCMRIEKPFEFMHLLFNFTGENYTEEKIRSIFASNQPTTIRLKKQIPVHIVYFTVRRENGKDYFLYDIYLHDQIIWESMEGHKKATFKVPAKRLDPLRKKKKKKRSYFF